MLRASPPYSDAPKAYRRYRQLALAPIVDVIRRLHSLIPGGVGWGVVGEMVMFEQVRPARERDVPTAIRGIPSRTAGNFQKKSPNRGINLIAPMQKLAMSVSYWPIFWGLRVQSRPMRKPLT